MKVAPDFPSVSKTGSHLNRINYGTSFQELAQNIRQGAGPMKVAPDFPSVSKTHSTGCKSLQTMFLLEVEVFFPQGVHSVNHLLDKLDLRVAKTVLVGHVISAAIIATRLSTGSTGLDSELLAPLLQGVNTFLGVSGQVNHDGSPHAGSEVGGAGVDVAVLLREGKFLA